MFAFNLATRVISRIARQKARDLGYEEYAEWDLDMWLQRTASRCETLSITKATGPRPFEGSYIDSLLDTGECLGFQDGDSKGCRTPWKAGPETDIAITHLGGSPRSSSQEL